MIYGSRHGARRRDPDEKWILKVNVVKLKEQGHSEISNLLDRLFVSACWCMKEISA